VQFKVVPREIASVVKFLKHLAPSTIDQSLNLLMIKVIQDMHEEIFKTTELSSDEKNRILWFDEGISIIHFVSGFKRPSSIANDVGMGKMCVRNEPVIHSGQSLL
jgi:hypothetical protein